MIYELRVYRAVPGRLPDLHERFSQHTTKFFAKHGIRVVGFWTTLVGPSTQELTYIVAYASLADRELRWGAFSSDPDWVATKKETERNGPIVDDIRSQFLVPTSYSPQP